MKLMNWVVLKAFSYCSLSFQELMLDIHLNMLVLKALSPYLKEPFNKDFG